MKQKAPETPIQNQARKKKKQGKKKKLAFIMCMLPPFKNKKAPNYTADQCEPVIRNADAVNHFGLNLAGAWKESQLFRDAANTGQAEHEDV